MEEAEHLAELAEQCQDKAKNTPPSFSRTKYLRRAEYLEQAAREKAAEMPDDRTHESGGQMQHSGSSPLRAEHYRTKAGLLRQMAASEVSKTLRVQLTACISIRAIGWQG